MMRHSLLDSATYHVCGGLILTDQGHDGSTYRHCERCGAFSYEDDYMPKGVDRGANRAAWDDGDDYSPEAEVRS